MMRSKRVDPSKVDFPIGKYRNIKVLDTGAQIRTKVCSFHSSDSHIVRLDKDHYKVKRTGKVKEIKHTQHRTDNIGSLAKSMQRLRDIINVNVSDIRCTTWLTLTYRENMQDEKKLYDDVRKFFMRLRYFCKKNVYPHFEYICAVEYQARGALHCHILLIWENLAPFISNDIMAEIWGYGFTKTTALRGNIENIGNYLTAYLTDLPLSEAIATKTDLTTHKVKTVNDKMYVKASRLSLYPSGCNLYRCSRGIKKPKEYSIPYIELLDMLDKRNAELSYENLLWLYEDSKIDGFSTLVQYRYYDVTQSAQQRVLMCKSYHISKFYRTMHEEMLEYSSILSEFQEFHTEFHEGGEFNGTISNEELFLSSYQEYL